MESGINPYESDHPQVITQSGKIDKKEEWKREQSADRDDLQGPRKEIQSLLSDSDLPLVICNLL